MLATIRAVVSPACAVDVYPVVTSEYSVRQEYVLTVNDGTRGTLELVFPCARDLQEFLTLVRGAFASAKQEVKARTTRFRPDSRAGARQSTLF